MNIKLSAFLLGVILLFSTGCAGDNKNSISETESSQNSISEASDISQNSNSKTDISQNSISKPESEPSEKNSASDISQNSNSKTESSPSSNSVENSGSENSNSKSEGSRAENSNSQNSNSKPESKPESSQNSNSKTESSQSSNPKPESSAPAPEPSKPESKPESSAPPAEPSKPESSAPAPEPSKPAEPSKLPVAAVSVTLSRHELTMTVGDTVQLSAEISPYDTDDQQLTWYWSDTSVIQIDSSVTVTAVGAGKATITVKTNNGKSDECIVTVKAKEQPKPVESSTKPSEPSKPSEVSKPIEQSSTAPAPSQPTTEPSQTSKEQSTQIDPKYAAYYYPYDDAAIIADLRSVGEKQYKMVWEDSLWVRSKGTEWGSKFDEEWGYRIVNGKYQGTCSFRFPVSNDECKDGKDFRDYCLYMYTALEREFKWDNETLEDLPFKIAIEDVTPPGTDYRIIWVYLLYA